MYEDDVVMQLADHLGSNECMILCVGSPDTLLSEDRFRVGQTYHNNQDAVVELAGFGFFPEGTVFAVKPRPKRKRQEMESLAFLEVHEGDLLDRKYIEIEDRVDWHRVSRLVEGRRRWEKRIAENQLLELEMEITGGW